MAEHYDLVLTNGAVGYNCHRQVMERVFPFFRFSSGKAFNLNYSNNVVEFIIGYAYGTPIEFSLDADDVNGVITCANQLYVSSRQLQEICRCMLNHLSVDEGLENIVRVMLLENQIVSDEILQVRQKVSKTCRMNVLREHILETGGAPIGKIIRFIGCDDWCEFYNSTVGDCRKLCNKSYGLMNFVISRATDDDLKKIYLTALVGYMNHENEILTNCHSSFTERFQNHPDKLKLLASVPDGEW